MSEYLDNLPSGSESDPPERIVCAANYYQADNVILCGIRHGSVDMYSMYDFSANGYNVCLHNKHMRQGFMTSKGRFVDRKEAWKIAVDQKQIVRRVGGDDSDGGTLYSENLY